MPRHAGQEGIDNAPGGLRPLTTANHVLHWISSLIVMSIAAYYIAHFPRSSHLIYWVTIAAIDSLLYLPAMVLPMMRKYRGYLAPLSWIFSYLWLTAFILAVQDYNQRSCHTHSPSYTSGCGLKKTLEAFSFIAFFTNLLGTLLEWKLYDANRYAPTTTYAGDKMARPSGDTTTTAPTAVV